MRGDRRGADPIVATLLIVAITIVLAAVLYVVVMAYGEIISNKPIGSFTGVTRMDTNSEKLTLSSFTPIIRFDQCLLRIDPPGDDPDGGGAEQWDMRGGIGDPYEYNDTITVSAVDVGGEGRMSQGDYFRIVWDPDHVPSGQWTVTVIQASSGNGIAEITFTI